MFLDNNQLYQLTRRKRSTAQVAVLRGMGIEHKVRPDGSVAVCEAHVLAIFGVVSGERKEKTVEPNWSAAR